MGVSLRTRLTLWYGALLAVTLLGFSALLYFTLQQSLASSVDDRLSLRADHGTNDSWSSGTRYGCEYNHSKDRSCTNGPDGHSCF